MMGGKLGMDLHVQRAPAARDRDLMLLLGGAVFFQAVVAAHRLGVFKALAVDGGATRDELAQRCSLPMGSARALLMTCQSLGLVTRDDAGRYRNMPWVTGAFARGDVVFPAMLEGFDQLLYRPFSHLADSLREGTNLGLEEFPGQGSTLYERLQSHPAREAVFHAWMSSLSASGLPARVMDSLASSKHVLDVGGGDGTNAVLLARAHPDQRVTILDLPTVCLRAAERVQADGLGDRIATLPCDIRTTSFPDGADAILFSRIFNIYSEQQNALFVQRSADALPVGGRLVIYPSTVADDDEGGPLAAAFLSLYFLCLATGTGRVYTPRDYAAWFQAAGFSSLDIHVNEADEAVIVGVR